MKRWKTIALGGKVLLAIQMIMIEEKMSLCQARFCVEEFIKENKKKT